MSKGTTRPSKFCRVIKAPFRALVRARDFYVNRMSGCTGRVQYGKVMGFPRGVVSGMPRSYSFHPSSYTTSEADLGELIRAASKGSMGSLNINGLQQERSKDGVVPKSRSVAIGRIDEEQEFEDDMVFPRSRSYAVVPNRRVGVLA